MFDLQSRHVYSSTVMVSAYLSLRLGSLLIDALQVCISVVTLSYKESAWIYQLHRHAQVLNNLLAAHARAA